MTDTSADSDGHLTPEVLAKVTAVLAQTDHIIQFTNEGWTIAHPLHERLDLDSLFDCQMRWDYGDIGFRGRYWLNWDENGDPTVGEKIGD